MKPHDKSVSFNAIRNGVQKIFNVPAVFHIKQQHKKGESSVVRIGGPAGLWLDSSDTLIELFLLGPSPHCPSFLQLRSQSFRPSSFPPVRMFTSRGRKTNQFSLSKKIKRFAINVQNVKMRKRNIEGL